MNSLVASTNGEGHNRNTVHCTSPECYIHGGLLSRSHILQPNDGRLLGYPSVHKFFLDRFTNLSVLLLIQTKHVGRECSLRFHLAIRIENAAVLRPIDAEVDIGSRNCNGTIFLRANGKLELSMVTPPSNKKQTGDHVLIDLSKSTLVEQL